MKKLMILLFSLSLLLMPPRLCANASECKDLGLTTAFSAGYVFKHDCLFKQVYGHGMINIITADFCYSSCDVWGIGAKISYWRAKGRTSFLKQCSLLQEVPITISARYMKDFCCRLQLYASLGAGVIWIKEKSYLGCVRVYKGIGEAEVGLNYPFWRCLNITGAVRYLFPRQVQECTKVDVGGCDLRAGLGYSF